MRLWIALAVLTSYLFATNPAIYAGLGDRLYDGMPKMMHLADTRVFANHREHITAFILSCEKAREEGLALEKGVHSEAEQKAYLERLRTLNKEYEFYIRTAAKALNRTIEQNDYKGFSELIKTGLIDIDKNSEQILTFYELNKGMGTLVEIEDYIAYREEIIELERREKEKRQEIYESYKQRRIDQVHARQEAKKRAQREAIDAEAERKKAELHKTQEEELKLAH